METTTDAYEEGLAAAKLWLGGGEAPPPEGPYPQDIERATLWQAGFHSLFEPERDALGGFSIKKFIRSQRTGRFFSVTGEWTEGLQDATAFKSHTDLLGVIKEHDLKDCDIYHRAEEWGIDDFCIPAAPWIRE